MTHNYSTVQKLSLAGIVIGALMCAVGGASPFWIISDPKGFGLAGELLAKFVTGYMGLFMYCIESDALQAKECKMFNMDNDDGWFHIARVTASACVLLGLLAAAISLCLACCTCCKRFIAVGIIAFLAAAAGAACVIIFARNTETFTSSIADFKLSSYGWSLYVFSVGVGLMGITSFMACFSAPDNPLHGIIFSQPSASVVAVSSQQNTHWQNQFPGPITNQQNPYMRLQEQYPVNPGYAGADPEPTANGY